MTIYKLENGVQHYAWGGTRFIPEFLGMSNEDELPFAELWMGTHDDLPSRAVTPDGTIRLGELVDGELPYLLKILSAAKPLSIQVHPTQEQARAGYARENASGIPLGARERNYRDENSKPELLCALTDFYALRGFRPELPPELAEFGETSLRSLYQVLMTMPQDDVDRALERLVAQASSRSHGKDDREYWLIRCHEEFSTDGHYDRGLFSIYLLNLLHLLPGDAIYLGAGTLHAYLEGSGIEIMANSNNVLRGGLTTKHVDIPELLETVVFSGEKPEIVMPVRAGAELVYPTPAREFELRRIETAYDNDGAHGDEILVVTEGEAELDERPFKRGEAAFVPRGEAYTVTGSFTVYKATVPAPP